MRRMMSGLVLFFCVSMSVYGGNDPSIKGDLRSNIQHAMKTHINNSLVKAQYVIFDSAKGEIKNLSLKKLHSGIVKKGDYFVSCADFSDAKGQLYDLDFLVTKTDDGKLKVIQSLVHAVAGNKRPYHVETTI